MKWNFRNCLIWEKKKKKGENRLKTKKPVSEAWKSLMKTLTLVSLESQKNKKNNNNKVNGAENKVQRKNGLKFLKFEIW